MDNSVYNGESLPFTIKAKSNNNGEFVRVDTLLSIEAICVNRQTGAVVKKYYFDPVGGSKDGYVPFYIPADYLSITATLSESETDSLSGGKYDMVVVLRYADERFTGGQRTAKYKALWFTIKEK